MTKNKSLYIVLSILLAVFLLASSIVFPLDKGLLGNLGVSLGRDLQGGTYLVYKADLSSVEEGTEDDIMKGVSNVISNRINPLGVTESSVEIQGDNQIVVNGFSLTDDQKTSLGSTARESKLATVDGEETRQSGQ